ncbi:uncharacterized protein LOC131671440 [Phymastichus coffea]|uniref:uncharacterized protein LOC131671440 n=1 Tax=Phymastichus coffea TaxID=108790 RepID=UPI00273BE04B|nr:uncharacterized protein LOC131671440 [Phymastichus coffea]
MSAATASGGAALRCVPVPPERHQELIEHLRQSFFADEPLNRAVGLCRRGEPHPELERHCLQTLGQSLSCMVVDAQHKIAGAALNGLIRRGEREECERRLGELRDDNFKRIFELLYRLNDRVDLFEENGVEELFEVRILSVDEAHRGRGLAQLLLDGSLGTASSRGFKVVKADATGVFSQRVFLKRGFEVRTEIAYSEVEARLRPGPPHQALKLMVKLLD